MRTKRVMIFKKPTESQMAISAQVKSSVQEAIVSLRDALAFASRSEHPMTIHNLSEILMRLESLEAMEEMFAKCGSLPGEHTH